MEYKRGELSGKILGILTIVGLALGAYFLSPVITGNTVVSVNQTTSNWVGAVLLVLGLAGAYAYWKKK